MRGFYPVNPVTLRKAKIVYNFGLSECNRVKSQILIVCSTGIYVIMQVKDNFHGSMFQELQAGFCGSTVFISLNKRFCCAYGFDLQF